MDLDWALREELPARKSKIAGQSGQRGWLTEKIGRRKKKGGEEVHGQCFVPGNRVPEVSSRKVPVCLACPRLRLPLFFAAGAAAGARAAGVLVLLWQAEFAATFCRASRPWC